MNTRSENERYARAKEIFFAALELDAVGQADLINAECGQDTDLRHEVESLLAIRDDADEFFKLPAFETVSQYDNLEGEIIGGYRLIRKLGVGGMGVVFLAEKDDPQFSRPVALKLVRDNLQSRAVFRRFDVERRILNSLEHPNIARLLDGGTSSGGLPYFVMEYVDGVPITEFVKSKNITLEKRLDLFRQVCAAVSFAHTRAVIHRDLKPSNILVTEDGTVKLLDFGIAKILSPDANPDPGGKTTMWAMTPEYASPEQIRRDNVTTASDIYSLGVILYELLTGTRPYAIDSENLNEIIHAVCEMIPVRPSSAGLRTNDNGRLTKLKGDLDNIILKALRKEPDRRYSSVEAFSDDLRRYLSGLPVSARADTFVYRTGKFVNRHRLAVAFSLFGVLILTGAIIGNIWQARRAETERNRAQQRFNDARTLANSFMFELNDEILKGQTQGRELVVTRALEYLDRLAAEAADDASLQRELAVAYLKIGDIQGKPYTPNLGNTGGAIESYRKAAAIMQNLAERDAASADIRRDRATVYMHIGSIQGNRTGESDEAVTVLQKALDIMEPLALADPPKAADRRIIADIYKALGDAYRTSDERLAAYNKALELRESLLTEDPANTSDLVAIASLNQRIGTLSGNERTEAEVNRKILEHFDVSLAIYKKLQDMEPDDVRHRRNVADMTAIRIGVLANLGDKPAVVDSFNQAMKIFEPLAAADPRNAEAQLDLAYTHQLLCRALIKLNDRMSGIDSCRRGLSIAEPLFASDPSNGEVHAYIFKNSRYIFDVLKSADDIQGMILIQERQLVSDEQWLAVEPNDPDGVHMASATCVRLGESHRDFAAKGKLSVDKKREHWKAARGFFNRAIGYFHRKQQIVDGKNDYSAAIRECEQEIARCDAELRNLESP